MSARKIRVLVVDDSVVVRRIVSDVLASDPFIEVVGTAANGRIALARIEQLTPDAVTLDIEMPEMDGLTTLKEIRRLYPTLPVIMFSTLTSRAAENTLEALALGANDYVTKPSQVGNFLDATQGIRAELIPKLKAHCIRRVGAFEVSQIVTRPVQPPRAKPAESAKPSVGPVDVVVIAVSTGGPNALAEVIPALPKELAAPVLIVQHMPPLFTQLLAERLSARSALPVAEAVTGTLVQPGHAWLAPGGQHMVVRRRGDAVKLETNMDHPENSCRPSADVLFRSVVEVYGGKVLAVVMTGMGQDGLRGCDYVKEAGGTVLAQDEPTSVVWGMPGFVANAGLADKVVPLPELAAEIIWRVRQRVGAGDRSHE